MSSFCKCRSYSHFFSKNISIYAIFNDESFNDMLTNDIVSLEQLGPESYMAKLGFELVSPGSVFRHITSYLSSSE